ncbi:hypothetical protein [Streptomyces huiliensis]|uniref:hypothetical protein n=1 Tax=Streptomyces huiliensis TaxID=2876027 RepID=UPI001CBDBF64|nr:hypothetical protein [Streptomyces huiliensis]MBZ4321891.1 hypothetical protein [Streptomyces huiliensis]
MSGGRRKTGAGRLTGHTLVLGVFAAVGGLAGAIRAVGSGAGVLDVLVALGIGVAGLALAIAYIVDFGRR